MILDPILPRPNPAPPHSPVPENSPNDPDGAGPEAHVTLPAGVIAAVTPAPPVLARPRVAPPPAPEAHCTGCNTTVPANERLCAICARAQTPPQSRATLLLHWLVFILGMTVIFGGGYLLAP